MKIIDGSKLPVMRVGGFGGMYFRKNGPFAKGQKHEGHEHYQDHVSMLTHGSVIVTSRQASNPGAVLKREMWIAPCAIPIPADTWHEIEAQGDGTVWWCVFREPDASAMPIPFHEEKPVAHDEIERSNHG